MFSVYLFLYNYTWFVLKYEMEIEMWAIINNYVGYSAILPKIITTRLCAFVMFIYVNVYKT